VVATFAGYNIYQSQKTEKIVSDLVIANVEALAGDTEGGATITCSRTCSDGVGRCYKVYDKWGNCHFDGSQTYSCTC
ncbi:NVEALA domain-containing protein, partial [Bacteroides fragilis]